MCIRDRLGLALSTSATLALFALLSLIAWVILRFAFEPPTGNVKTFQDDVND